ncbi:MAG: hypothetical protein F6K19_31330 [Cyanothece sp. SIO1E1]|nr:hypothetical protein [Cyanothece sp. SIO1E1]
MSLTSRFTLNLMGGSVGFSFTPEAARELQAAISALLASLKVVGAKTATAGVSQKLPQKPMEYQHAGEVFLEVFCNPNIWPTPFAARALITLRDERIRLSTEIELTQMIEDINQYLEQVG